MKRLRRVLLGLLVVLVVLGIAGEVARRYLVSRQAAARVTARLEAAYGGPVQVGAVDVGLGSTELQGVQVYESGADTRSEPWAVLGTVRADVSLWDLIRGEATPSRLTLTEPRVTLRFDRAGRLLTRLPQAEGGREQLPAVRVENGQVTIRQEGRPTFTVTGVSGDLSPQGDQLAVNGQVRDPHWGDWSLKGGADRHFSRAEATLTTEHVHVTQAMLESLPLIAPGVWRQVRVEGDTPVELTVRRGSDGGGHFRVALRPRATRVHVAAIDLDAADATGQVVVEDEVVRLRDVHGRAAGGTVETTADLDFSRTPNRLHFTVRVRDLELHQLPKNWSLPAVDGKLTGKADLVVTVADGRARTSGEGDGVINGAKVAGENATIRLKLRAAGDGYEFVAQSALPAASGLSVALTLMAPLGTADDRAGQSFLPAQVANRFTGLLLEGMDALTSAGREALAYIPRRPAQPAPRRAGPPRYLEVNLAMHDADLEHLVRGLDVPVPVPVSGRLTIQVRAAFPIDTPRDPRTYRLDGTARLSRLTVGGLALEQVEARVRYADGLLRLDDFRGRVPREAGATAGGFDGAAGLQLYPAGLLDARLTLDRVPLARVLAAVPDAAGRARGAVSGTATLRAPVQRLEDVTTWQGDGHLSADRVEAFGWALDRPAADVTLRGGTVAVTGVRGRLEGTPVGGEGTLRLGPPYRYRGTVTLHALDLAALGRLAPAWRPPVAVAGRLAATTDFRGTLRPAAVEASGTATADDLRVEGVRLRELRLKWAEDGRLLRLTDVRGTLYGGTVTGTAAVPLRDDATGRVQARFQDVDMAALERDLPALPVRVEGKVGGHVDGTLPPAPPGRPRVVNATLDLTAPRLRVQGLPAERLHGTVEYRAGAIDYKLTGDTLGGTFDVTGKYPPAAPPAAAPPPDGREGRLRVRGARLSRLADALGNPALRPLAGRFDLELLFRFEGPDRTPTGTGTMSLTRLRWGDTEIAPSITAALVVGRDEVRFRNLAGTVAEGTLRGQAIVTLRRAELGRFNLALDGAEASRLLAPWPDLAAQVQGTVDVRLRGTAGPEWLGSGSVEMVRGKVAGLDVTGWRLPLDFVAAPGQGRWQARLPDITAQVAAGRVTGRAEIGGGLGSRIDGQLRFAGLDLGALSRSFSERVGGGTGQVSGRLDFGGTDVRTVDDVTATLRATMQQPQAMTLPILEQLMPFITPGPSGGTFRTGDLQARLARGVVRVQRLALAGPTTQLFAQGDVTLQGRLALDVTARTGIVGPNLVLLQQLGLLVPAAGPLPVGLVLRASQLLSNHVVHLRVLGTVRSPTIQVEPISLLAEEAIRFFLTQQFPAAAALPAPLP